MRRTDHSRVANLLSESHLTGPGSAASGPAGIVADRPIIISN
jgi:hypothetical protein